MSVLISHPTGNANVRNALLSLHESQLLGKFITTVAAFESNVFGKLSTTKIGAEFSRRRYDECLHLMTEQYPCRELGRMLSLKLGIASLSSRESSPFSVQRIYEGIDQHAAKYLESEPSIKAVYAYEDGAYQTFSTAGEHGITRLYELPTTYWRTTHEILSDEAERKPEWSSTIPALKDSSAKLERKDQELALADQIIAPSRFCAQSIIDSGISSKSPIIVSYGCPEPIKLSREQAESRNEKIKLLFVGNLSQGKGLSYLFDAVDELEGQVELTLIGRRINACARLDRELKKHNWLGTMPHSDVLKTMRAHDLLVFPSLLEGFGMVITEALSQGLPVITTPHTCAPEIIEDGVSGFIVPVRDAAVIVERVNQLHRDHEKLVMMKHSALETARNNSWQQYRKEFSEIIKNTLIR